MARHVFLTGPPGERWAAGRGPQSSELALPRPRTRRTSAPGEEAGRRHRPDPVARRRRCRVGQYVVDVTSFELALPILRNVGSGGPGRRVCVIDEIGKMELFSQPFIQAVRQTLSSPGTVVLGTIPIPKGKLLALVEEIRSRPDVKVFSVTKENRNLLLPDIVKWVQSSGK
ncbi:Hypothetical predicted protein [Marmota monax]|uniref:Cancer-related nucleoside-triphosphatase n=1 Tax=Marmota monax TaxID=9995 RepID=A0A5E4B055_MARMO|nr:Hypothetical predicted protein [Marmota monax]